MTYDEVARLRRYSLRARVRDFMHPTTDQLKGSPWRIAGRFWLCGAFSLAFLYAGAANVVLAHG